MFVCTFWVVFLWNGHCLLKISKTVFSNYVRNIPVIINMHDMTRRNSDYIDASIVITKTKPYALKLRLSKIDAIGFPDGNLQ